MITAFVMYLPLEMKERGAVMTSFVEGIARHVCCGRYVGMRDR